MGFVGLAFFGFWSAVAPTLAAPPAPPGAIWAGMPIGGKPRAKAERSRLYLPQGVTGVDSRGRAFFHIEGMFPHPLLGHDLLLSARVESLVKPTVFLRPLNDRAAYWRDHGNSIRGIQLALEPSLAARADLGIWLKQVRAALASELALSVAGLPPDRLKAIVGSVDEVVFSLPKPGLGLSELNRLEVPFRIGVLPTTELRTPLLRRLQANPAFRGVLVLLERSPN